MVSDDNSSSSSEWVLVSTSDKQMKTRWPARRRFRSSRRCLRFFTRIPVKISNEIASALDSPGAAERVALPEHPRPLLLGKLEEPPDHLAVVELGEPHPVALAHSPRLRLQPQGDPLELVEMLFVQAKVMAGDCDEPDRHLVGVAGTPVICLGHERS